MSCSPEPRLGLSRRNWILLAAGMANRTARAEGLRQMPRVDEGRRDPELALLLDRMSGIVDRRDYRGLEALMFPDFKVEFDVGKGPRAFRLHWRHESGSSTVWEILQRLLSLGGTFYSSTLYALPYVYTRFPNDLDPLEHVVAVKDDVALLAGPAPDANRVGSLRCSIVPLAERVQPPVVIPAHLFVELKHPEAGRCFASASDVYSPAAHRAFFEQRKGCWHWISLAAATLAEPPDLKQLKERS